MASKSLIGNNLFVNTKYRVTLSLADDPYTKESFIIETPNFPSEMSSYMTSSRVSKDVSKEIQITPKITTPGYYTETNIRYALKGNSAFKVIGISTLKKANLTSTVTGGNDSTADPFKLKVTIELTFDKDLKKEHITQLENFNQSFSSLNLNISDGEISGQKIIIRTNLGVLDPNIGIYGALAPVTKRNNEWGFWDYPIFVALKDIYKDKSNSKCNNFWKGAYFEYNPPAVYHDSITTESKTKTTFRLSSTLYSKVPDSIQAATINQFRNDEDCCVDYYFFFVSQDNKNWYYFNDTGKGIKPSTSDSGSKLKGENGVFDPTASPPKLSASQLKKKTRLSIL